jgi:hypothetical protein
MASRQSSTALQPPVTMGSKSQLVADHNIRKELDSFLSNLEHQLTDADLEEEGYIIRCYFDTVDMVDVVKGMMAFFNARTGRFDTKSFDRPEVLARSLVLGGWLGPVRMLVPHQAEFLNLLDLDFGIGLTKNWLLAAQDFLHALQIDPKLPSGRSLKDLSEQEIRGYVQAQAASAARFFNAVQAVNGTWMSRLARLRSSGLLDLSAEEIDIEKLFKAHRFKKVKAALDHLRPEVSLNNFADAAAAELLMRQIEELQDGVTKFVPRFFASSRTLETAITNAGYDRKMFFGTTNTGATSVLRKSDYFILRATFLLQPSVSKAHESTVSLNDLRQIRGRLKILVEDSKPLTIEVLNQISVGGRDLYAVIQRLRRFVFLENVWLNTLAVDEVKNAISQLHEFDALMASADDERFRASVNQAIYSTRHALEVGTSRYRDVNKFWDLLSTRLRIIRGQYGRETSSTQPFAEFGLVRFGFPEDHEKALRHVLAGVLSSNRDQNVQAQNLLLAAWLHEVKVGTDSSEAFFTAAVLWACRLDAQLIQMLNTGAEGRHFSLRVMLAAALLREGEAAQAGAWIDNLTLEFERKRVARLAIGLAYLNYHQWQLLGFRPRWRYEATQPTSAQYEDLITKALEFAKFAYETTDPSSVQQVYALNLLVYYGVEGGSDAEFEETRRYAVELLSFRTNASIWQYRYFDTLARYFHRLSLAAVDPSERTRLLERARQMIDAAARISAGDPEVDSYRAELDIWTTSPRQAPGDEANS